MSARFDSQADMSAWIRSGAPAPAAQTAVGRVHHQPQEWPPHIDGRTFQPVLRGSEPYEAGDRFYRRRSMAFLKSVKQLALRLVLKSMELRKDKERWGAFSPIDLQILDKMMFTWMDWKTGKLECTYDRMRSDTGRATDTINASIKRLVGLGLLEKMRRFRRVEESGEVKVMQAPNAYRILLPERLLRMVGMEPGPSGPPIPDDARVHDQAEQLARGMMRQQDTGKSSLEASLGRLGGAVTQRDSS